VDVPAQNTDLLPTLADFCGIELPPPAPADTAYAGTSLAPLLRGEVPDLPDRTFVVQYGQNPAKFDACVVRGRWRLVKGAELYDIAADRAQQVDVAAGNPAVVAELRAFYESWWAGVEPLVNDLVPLSIGSEAEPSLELNSGDWEGIYADNTGYVREAVGGPTGGHWNILVERPGTYTFTLRRWPARAEVGVGEAYLPTASSPAYRPDLETKSFPAIASAQIEIAGQSRAVSADPKAPGIPITLDLPAGRTRLKAWFADEQGRGLCGAFFVGVERKD
jgi:hypothetical protein